MKPENQNVQIKLYLYALFNRAKSFTCKSMLRLTHMCTCIMNTNPHTHTKGTKGPHPKDTVEAEITEQERLKYVRHITKKEINR